MEVEDPWAAWGNKVESKDAWIEIELAEWGITGRSAGRSFEVISCKRPINITPDSISVEIMDVMIGGIRMKDVLVDKHNAAILRMTVYNARNPTGATRFYAITEDSQRTAACDLESEIDKQKKGKEVAPQLAGPRRFEVTLQVFGPAAVNPGEKPILVTDVGIHPGDALSGKVILSDGKPSVTTIRYSALQCFPRKIEEIPAGALGNTVTYYFNTHTKQDAWAKVKHLWESIPHGQRFVIKSWQGGGPGYKTPLQQAYEDDEYGWAGEGSTHWPRHDYTPPKPAKAHYRVAGDEAGAELFKKQGEVGSLLTPEMSIRAVLGAPEEKKMIPPVIPPAGALNYIHLGRCRKCGRYDCASSPRGCAVVVH